MEIKPDRKRGTLASIAAQCHVSTRVAAAVLSPRGPGTVGFSQATRRRVEAEARRVGYQANRTARWLACGRHGSIGVIAHSPYVIPEPMMNGLLWAARERRLFLVLERAPERARPMFLQERCVDGLLSFDELRETDRRRIGEMRLPTIWVNTNRRRGRNVITYDERTAARSGIEHLLTAGWARPMTLGLEGPHYSVRDRLSGAREGAPEDVSLVLTQAPWGAHDASEDSVTLVEQFLRSHAHVDSALILHGALIPALYQALLRTGRHPGRDFGVVTFGHYGAGLSVVPHVTALGFDEQALGVRMVEVLWDLVEGSRPVALPLNISYELYVRDSTRRKRP
jgi:DNA-binding LacI/PurR family transcriptional regulator